MKRAGETFDDVLGIGRRVTRRFDRRDDPGSGFSFPCDDDGVVDVAALHPNGRESFAACMAGVDQHGAVLIDRGVQIETWRYTPARPPKRCGCGGDASFRTYCGADVCDRCGAHLGLARCFCGWSASGGDGRRELEEMGETIDEDWS